MNNLGTTVIPVPIPVGGGSSSEGCSGYYEKWMKFSDGSWRCTPLKWEEMDEYLTWRWWTYKVHLPIGIIGGLVVLVLLILIIGWIWARI